MKTISISLCLIFSIIFLSSNSQRSDYRFKEHILAVELLGMLVDTSTSLPIACTADEIDKMIKSYYNIHQHSISKNNNDDIKAIINALELVKIQLQKGTVSKDELLRQLISCTESCGHLVNIFSGCYVLGMKDYFKGFIFFNFGSSDLSGSLPGDETHTFRLIDNHIVLTLVLQELQNTNYKLVIEGRASLPGNEKSNENLSDNRSEKVRNWFLNRGIDKNRIETLYLGEVGPYITEGVCEIYGHKNLFDNYYSYAPKSIDNYGNVVINGLNQSVSLYLVPQNRINLTP